MKTAKGNKEVKRVKILDLPIEQIHIDKSFNIRLDYGDIQHLKEDIKQRGILEPIRVKFMKSGENKGKYLLVDGFRRMTAVNELIEEGFIFDYIRAIPSKGSEEELILEMLSSGINKKNLNLVEIAEGAKRLKEKGLNARQIAEKLGYTHTYIYDLLRVAIAPQMAKQMVIDKQLNYKDLSRLVKEHKNNLEQLEEILTAKLDLLEQPAIKEEKEQEELKEESTELKEEGAKEQEEEGAKEQEEEGAKEQEPKTKKTKKAKTKLNAVDLGLEKKKAMKKFAEAIERIEEGLGMNISPERELTKTQVKRFDKLKKLYDLLSSPYDNTISVREEILKLIK